MYEVGESVCNRNFKKHANERLLLGNSEKATKDNVGVSFFKYGSFGHHYCILYISMPFLFSSSSRSHSFTVMLQDEVPSTSSFPLEASSSSSPW